MKADDFRKLLADALKQFITGTDHVHMPTRLYFGPDLIQAWNELVDESFEKDGDMVAGCKAFRIDENKLIIEWRHEDCGKNWGIDKISYEHTADSKLDWGQLLTEQCNVPEYWVCPRAKPYITNSQKFIGEI
jgi:hypothetical protein